MRSTATLVLITAVTVGYAAEESPPMSVAHRPRRNRLLFNHLPKTGGTYTWSVLSKAVGNSSLQPESVSLSQFDIASSFVVGSIRYPCDYYLSLWAYHNDEANRKPAGSKAVLDKRRARRMKWEDSGWIGKQAPYNSSADLDAFSRWLEGNIKHRHHNNQRLIAIVRDGSIRLQLPYGASAPPPTLPQRSAWELRRLAGHDPASRTPGVSSSLTSRFQHSYGWQLRNKGGELDETAVDCWLGHPASPSNGNLALDIRRCLGTFEAQGGIVDWVEFERISKHSVHNPSVHGACQLYFNESRETIVREVDAGLFELFGFRSCCRPSNRDDAAKQKHQHATSNL